MLLKLMLVHLLLILGYLFTVNTECEFMIVIKLVVMIILLLLLTKHILHVQLMNGSVYIPIIRLYVTNVR